MREFTPLSPDTVFQLRELSAKDIANPRDQSLKIIATDKDDLFERFIVRSGEKEYEVVRMGYMVRCECKSFEFGHKTGCKHVLATLPNVCVVCLKVEVAEPTGKCSECFQLTEGFLHKRRAA